MPSPEHIRMDKTYSFFLKNREDAVEIEAAKLEDDGARLRLLDDHNVEVAVFVWSELQGYTVES
jgi:hypothetical protein